MIRLFVALALAGGLAGCVVAPPYGYAAAPAYGYYPAPAYYATPTIGVGIGIGGGGYGWHGR